MDKIPKTLMGLIQKYSPTGHVADAVHWLENRMRELSFDQTYIDGVGNIVGMKGNGAKQIVLLGHIDTVPGEINVRLEGDRLFGRGSVDAKGSLAAFIDAVDSVNPAEDWQICVIGAMDEEGESHGARFISENYKPEFAIIGEPSQWNRVTLGYKGVQNADLIVSLPLIHSSKGESANDVLLASWQRVLERVSSYNREKPMYEQITPTVLDMDYQNDGFMTHARLSIGARLPESVSPREWLQDWLESLPGVEIKPVGEGLQAYKSSKNTELTRAFIASIRAEGGDAAYVVKGGTSDLNIVAPAWNCPIVAYGPGSSDLDHTPNEHIQLEEYRKAVEVLKIVMARLGVAKLD